MNKSYKKLLHLYSRAGFGLNRKRADQLLKSKSEISYLFDKSKLTTLSIDMPTLEEMKSEYSMDGMMKNENRRKIRKLQNKYNREVVIAWIDQMSSGSCDLVEKMALFWHGHFACRITNPNMSLQYTNVLRNQGLGDFKTLLKSVSKSPAMINYLHLRQNKKKNPNEDFARELCELFTLGRDIGYTESDVKEIARAFTGWNIDKNFQFKYREKQHDKGDKTIFGKTKNFNGDEVFDLILEKKECAHFISTKIYKYFVNPIPNEQNINEITEKLYNSKYNIGETMKFIFTSKWFFDDENIGVKIKSPVELIVTLKKQFDLKPKTGNVWILIQRNLDQVLLNPPNVAGWPGDKNWIDASRLAQRLRLASILLNNGSVPIAYKEDYDSDPMEDRRNAKKYRKFQCDIDWSEIKEKHQEDKKCSLSELLIRGKLSNEAQTYLNNNQIDNFEDTLIQILSLPEYQLC